MESINFIQQQNSFFHKSEEGNIIRTTETCGCSLTFKEYWIRTNKKCSKCLKNDQLKLENKELKEKLELAKVNHEEFIDKSENWHREQLAQKNEEIYHWKSKLQSLEQKFNQLESKYSELIENK